MGSNSISVICENVFSFQLMLLRASQQRASLLKMLILKILT